MSEQFLPSRGVGKVSWASMAPLGLVPSLRQAIALKKQGRVWSVKTGHMPPWSCDQRLQCLASALCANLSSAFGQ